MAEFVGDKVEAILRFTRNGVWHMKGVAVRLRISAPAIYQDPTPPANPLEISGLQEFTLEVRGNGNSWAASQDNVSDAERLALAVLEGDQLSSLPLADEVLMTHANPKAIRRADIIKTLKPIVDAFRKYLDKSTTGIYVSDAIAAELIRIVEAEEIVE